MLALELLRMRFRHRILLRLGSMLRRVPSIGVVRAVLRMLRMFLQWLRLCHVVCRRCMFLMLFRLFHWSWGRFCGRMSRRMGELRRSGRWGVRMDLQTFLD